MRLLTTTVALTALTIGAGTPLFAQERGIQNSNAYITGLGGFATSVGTTNNNTTSDVMVEGGVRIAPHLMVFASGGRFGNLQGDLQPTLDSATTALAANQGLTVVGGGRLPAWYGAGGLRFEVPTQSRILPYVLGGLGVARLNPTPQLFFSSGTMPDGSTPAVGDDVTSAIVAAGDFTAPPSSNALLLMLGGGIEIPVVPHWVIDAGYRYSRIAADSTLSASPLNANSGTFGVGYRF